MEAKHFTVHRIPTTVIFGLLPAPSWHLFCVCSALPCLSFCLRISNYSFWYVSTCLGNQLPSSFCKPCRNQHPSHNIHSFYTPARLILPSMTFSLCTTAMSLLRFVYVICHISNKDYIHTYMRIWDFHRYLNTQFPYSIVKQRVTVTCGL